MAGDRLIQATELKQTQRLTPMQVRFVRMLEMTEPELEQEVNRALDEMPALEVATNDDSQMHDDDFNETSEQVQLADYKEDDMPSHWLESPGRYQGGSQYEPIAENDEPTLYESLRSQLDELDINGIEKAIAIEIIGNLDENGYLKREYRQIADDITISTGHETSEIQVEEAAKIIRNLEPAGVGAHDLRDCLLLQLKRMPESRYRDLATKIISRHFDSLSLKHYDRLTERLSISDSELRKTLSLIRSLNPKPGSSIGESRLSKSSSIIVPDFSVEVDGPKISIALNNRLPELCIEQSFATDDIVRNVAKDRQKNAATLFLHSRRDEAAMFIKALELRQQTLFNVMSAIVDLQHDFFISGDEGKLRPMILKDIAAITGYDMSTVSRAAAGKYVSTATGVYPLKFFFNEKSPAGSSTESAVASIHVANSIKRLIESEDKCSPLTDQELTVSLKKIGLDVARRTVAKYRDRLGFPVARLRKEI